MEKRLETLTVKSKKKSQTTNLVIITDAEVAKILETF